MALLWEKDRLETLIKSLPRFSDIHRDLCAPLLTYFLIDLIGQFFIGKVSRKPIFGLDERNGFME